MSEIKNLHFQLLPFAELQVSQLYDLLRLRSEVFVVEQHCVFLDMDNKDQGSWHLLGYEGSLLVAVARLLPPGLTFREMSIGRVVTASCARGTGMGRPLMEEAIRNCHDLFGKGPIRIGAQYHLRKFYESTGFQVAGEVYDEDGIDHVEMLRCRADNFS